MLMFELAGEIRPTPHSPVSFYSPVVAADRPGRQPIAFRQFVALPAARALLHMGTSLPIGGRAFDLLLALLRARGRLVRKQDLMRQVWPGLFVDEVNLRFQVAMLRKLLGRDRDLIKTVTGRGYLLIDDSGI